MKDATTTPTNETDETPVTGYTVKQCGNIEIIDWNSRAQYMRYLDDRKGAVTFAAVIAYEYDGDIGCTIVGVIIGDELERGRGSDYENAVSYVQENMAYERTDEN